MSRKNKAYRAFIHQHETGWPDRKDAWDAAWANQQDRICSKKHQAQQARITELEAENTLMKEKAAVAFNCFWNGGWYERNEALEDSNE